MKTQQLVKENAKRNFRVLFQKNKKLNCYMVDLTLNLDVHKKKMFLFLFATFISSFSRGYHTYVVTHKKPFHIKLSSSILVFVLDDVPPSHINFTSINNINNRATSIPVESLSQMQFFDTTLFVSVPKKVSYPLHFWLVPLNLCPGISYAVTSDFAVSYSLSTKKAKSDFCIFPQASASSYSYEIQGDLGSSNPKIEFYKSPNTVKPAKKCSEVSDKKTCSYSSSTPSFVKVKNVAGSSIDLKMIYKVKRASSTVHDCSVKAIPFAVGGVLPQFASGDLRVDGISCYSAAEETLTYVKIGSVVIIITIVVIVVLQIAGFINIKIVCCGGTSSDDRFNQLKQNPYANEIELQQDVNPVKEEEA